VILYIITHLRELMRPGRPRCPRRIEREPSVTYFKPRGIPLDQLDVMVITLEELETVRLVDLEGMEQEIAAASMGISRRAFWDDLQRARMKIAEALIDGKAIRIDGGSYQVNRKSMLACLDCQNVWEEPLRLGGSQRCPRCESANICKNQEKASCKGRRIDPGANARPKNRRQGEMAKHDG
jgi:uncharacterized protein